jgi:hypothetical protein
LREASSVAKRAALRDPRRPLVFALAVLIHVGLWNLLVRPRHTSSDTAERRTVLVFLPDAKTIQAPPRTVAPLAPKRLLETSPPENNAPRLIAPPEREGTPALPMIDWRREAEEAAREHVLEAQAERGHKDDSAPPKPQPEFGWDHSRVHRIEPLESGGLLVWINDRCAIVISVMAMPICKIGKKPARGDLFEHMDDAPTPGDWKEQ